MREFSGCGVGWDDPGVEEANIAKALEANNQSRNGVTVVME